MNFHTVLLDKTMCYDLEKQLLILELPALTTFFGNIFFTMEASFMMPSVFLGRRFCKQTGISSKLSPTKIIYMK